MNLSMIKQLSNGGDMNDELTDKQRKLVDTIVTTGCTSIKEAGIIAGYSTKNNTEAARVSASRTLRDFQRYRST